MQRRTAQDTKQSRRMLLALVLLLAAIVVTVLRDRDDLFGSGAPAEEAVASQSSAPISQAASISAAAPQRENISQAGPQALPTTPVAPVSKPVERSLPVPTTTTTHKPLAHVRNDAAKVATLPHSAPAAAAPVINAAERERMPAATKTIPQPEASRYPLLAQQMKVQGSVVLQALIGADGVIQDLRVVTGPAILGSAAREAVLQWRFKPYVENGKPVETQATITVNFTIKVMDNSTTSASFRPERVIILPNS